MEVAIVRGRGSYASTLEALMAAGHDLEVVEMEEQKQTPPEIEELYKAPIAQDGIFGSSRKAELRPAVSQNAIMADSLTTDELYRRIRARVSMTRGRYRGELRRAIKAGFLERYGIQLKLTELGRKIIGNLFVEAEVAA